MAPSFSPNSAVPPLKLLLKKALIVSYTDTSTRLIMEVRMKGCWSAGAV